MYFHGLCTDSLKTANGLDECEAYGEIRIFSHITSVLHVFCPTDMQGGHLVLWPPHNTIDKSFIDAVPPAHVVTPKVCLAS